MKKNYSLNSENRIISTTSYPINDELPLFDFPDDFNFEHQQNHKIINNKLVFDEMIIEVSNEIMIAELKTKLSDTDYVAIKIAEGAATIEDYAEVITERQAWRTEINRLQETK